MQLCTVFATFGAMFKGFERCYKNRLAATVACLFFALCLSGQNVVLVKSPDYLIFRWGNDTRSDTLDTAGISEFLVFMGKADSADAAYLEHQIVYFLKRSPTLVDSVDSAMQRSLFIGLDEYRDWLNLEQKKVKIVKQ